MVFKIKQLNAIGLLLLFGTQFILQLVVFNWIVENRAFQHDLLKSGLHKFETISLTESQFQMCYENATHELHFNNSFYDIKTMERKDGIVKLQVLKDRKEGVLKKFTKKSSSKSNQRNTQVKQISDYISMVETPTNCIQYKLTSQKLLCTYLFFQSQYILSMASPPPDFQVPNLI